MDLVHLLPDLRGVSEPRGPDVVQVGLDLGDVWNDDGDGVEPA